MKIKYLPSDFAVDELISSDPSSGGNCRLYRLEKTGWTTPDAIQFLSEQLKVPRDAFSFGGLKDRHAVTTQHVTIWNGPNSEFAANRIRLTPIGTRVTPFTSADIHSNRFQLVVRNLGHVHDQVSNALEELRDVGFPNYFDDQRFGSVGSDGQFVARKMLAGLFEEALKLALIGPRVSDRAPERLEKEILARHWGDWHLLKKKLRRSSNKFTFHYLAARPGDFAGVLERLRPEMQGLYLSAYQSHLWNRMLGHWLTVHVPAESRIDLKLKLGQLPAPRKISDGLRVSWETLELPYPSARLKPAGTENWFDSLGRVLAEEDLALEDMKLKMRRPFFSKGFRKARVVPDNLHVQFAPDEFHPGREKLILAFELPPGSYATLVLKRLLQGAPFDSVPFGDTE